jgi:hypothetical protein
VSGGTCPGFDLKLGVVQWCQGCIRARAVHVGLVAPDVQQACATLVYDTSSVARKFSLHR